MDDQEHDMVLAAPPSGGSAVRRERPTATSAREDEAFLRYCRDKGVVFPSCEATSLRGTIRGGLRNIERGWDGPMANNRSTRIRFAMWDAMKLAAFMASGASRRRILAALREDVALFDRYGAGVRR